MTLFELVENKINKLVSAPPPRNFVAKHAKTSGAGSHDSKKFSRKEKHKTNPKNDSFSR